MVMIMIKTQIFSGNTDATFDTDASFRYGNSLLVLDSRSYASLSVCVCVLLMLLFSQGY